jgi:hypothetical protein
MKALFILTAIIYFLIAYTVGSGTYSNNLPITHEFAITVVFILGGFSSLMLIILKK